MTGPFTNLVQQLIIEYALWLPGNQIMSGIVPQVSRTRHNPGSRKGFELSVELSGTTAIYPSIKVTNDSFDSPALPQQ